MTQFRKDVKNTMGGTAGTMMIATAVQNDTGGHKVKIMASVLNVRKGPGINYGIATQVKQGEVYTIVTEEKNGSTTWGKLKSGAGYISLGYTKIV